MILHRGLVFLSLLLGLAWGGLAASAQTVDTTTTAKAAKAPANVDIEADQMEVLDQQKKAIFTGKVNAKRADVTLTCDKLVVTYTETTGTQEKKTSNTQAQKTSDAQGQTTADAQGQTTADAQGQKTADAQGQKTADAQGQKTADAQGQKKTEVTFLDADGNVVIVTAKQTVTGKTAHMDVKANKLWVKGDVKVVQGKTVMNGEQLYVDLKTNQSEMTGGRVKGSFVPGG